MAVAPLFGRAELGECAVGWREEEIGVVAEAVFAFGLVLDTALGFRPEGGAIVTIDRPEVRNAVDGPTAAALADAFRRFDADAELAAAVLTGGNNSKTINQDGLSLYVLIILSNSLLLCFFSIFE